jgi:hypothetical protein
VPSKYAVKAKDRPAPTRRYYAPHRFGGWAAECGLKKGFASASEADAFLVRKGLSALHSYSCPRCALVHLGHRR